MIQQIENSNKKYTTNKKNYLMSLKRNCSQVTLDAMHFSKSCRNLSFKYFHFSINKALYQTEISLTETKACLGFKNADTAKF